MSTPNPVPSLSDSLAAFFLKKAEADALFLDVVTQAEIRGEALRVQCQEVERLKQRIAELENPPKK